jgi:hypothetical protein
MITQTHDLEAMSAVLSTLPNLADWLTTWPKARAEFETLIGEYRARFPEGDAYRLELMLDTTDRTLYELHHRLAWLEGQLALAPTRDNY